MEDGVKTIDRRRFTTLAGALALLGGVTITIGCGSDSPPSSPTGGGNGGTGGTGDGSKTGTISNNHGHVATISAAQLTAGGELQLDIRGAANHPHRVTLSGAELASIEANQRVTKESTMDDGHTHDVTFN